MTVMELASELKLAKLEEMKVEQSEDISWWAPHSGCPGTYLQHLWSRCP